MRPPVNLGGPSLRAPTTRATKALRRVAPSSIRATPPRQPRPSPAGPFGSLPRALLLAGKVAFFAEADFEEDQGQRSTQPRRDQDDGEDFARHSCDQDGARHAYENKRSGHPERQLPLARSHGPTVSVGGVRMTAADELHVRATDENADRRAGDLGSRARRHIGVTRYSQVQVFATAPAQSADRKTNTVCDRGPMKCRT